jgi:hypothetical protein
LLHDRTRPNFAVYRCGETSYGALVQETTNMTVNVEITQARSSALKPEVTGATNREVFASVYRDARCLRGVVCNEFVTCGSVEVFVSDTRRVVVGRRGDYGDRPGFYAACVGNRGSKSARRYFLERSREQGRVPLPK